MPAMGSFEFPSPLAGEGQGEGGPVGARRALPAPAAGAWGNPGSPRGPSLLTLARAGVWSVVWISGLKRPGKAGPYAHHPIFRISLPPGGGGPGRGGTCRGEACLARSGGRRLGELRFPPRALPPDACARGRVEHRLDFRTQTARQSRALRPPPNLSNFPPPWRGRARERGDL